MSKKLRALILGDCAEQSHALVKGLWHHGYSVVHRMVNSLPAMRAALEQEPWDVVLADGTTPASGGAGAAELIRSMKLDLPFIPVTAAAEQGEATLHVNPVEFANRRTGVVAAIERRLGEAASSARHKRAEAVLHRSEGDLADFFENAPVGLHWLGPDGRILRANRAELELLGYTREDYVGRHISEFHVDQEVIEGILKRLGAQETVRNQEARLRCKDGSIKEVLIDANVLWEDGRFVRSRGFTRDISEIKCAQGVLRESESRFRSLFEHAPIAIALHGADGRYLQTNRAYQRMLGYSEEELKRRGVKGVTHPHDVGEGRALFHELLEGKRDSYRREKRYFRSDGSLVWAQSTASAVRSLSGRLRYIISMVEDITERKKLAQEILSISEREQQRFGRDLHDGLCQNLIGLKLKATLLDRKLSSKGAPETREAKTVVTLLNQAIEEAHNLAQGLDPVKLEADGLMCALEELAAATESLFGVACCCRIRRPVLVADNQVAVHLYRIAQEAIANAVKHGKATRVWIGLNGRQRRVTLWIRDNGAGFRADSEKKGGMGLRIMKYRAGMIGASLEFVRRTLGGTRVICRVPSPSPKRNGKEAV
jgi:PAS domain S-box-containing protein